MLLIQEDNEVRRILYTLTVMIGEQMEAFQENSRIMERLDYAFSKGKLSMEWNCVPPRIHTGRGLKLTGARHPLMNREVAVPLDFLLGEDMEASGAERNSGEEKTAHFATRAGNEPYRGW